MPGLKNELRLDKRLHARWDNQLGLIAWLGKKGGIGYRCDLKTLIVTAAARGGCHAR